jgi:hypothetical protein
MSAWRKRILGIVFAAFIASHLPFYCTGDQHWPIVNYPMFADNNDREPSCPAVYGVPVHGAEFLMNSDLVGIEDLEICFVVKKALHYPKRNAGYTAAAAECVQADARERERCASERLVAHILAALYTRYEQSRSSNNKLPALRGLKIYEMTFAYADDTFRLASQIELAQWSPPETR